MHWQGFIVLRLRLPMFAAVMALTLAVSGGAAQAATSEQVIHHADGKAAGHVWFNSGTHNMEKGRNSFTVKDVFCGDGWKAGVQFEVPQLGISGWYASRGDCAGEASFSADEGDLPRSVIYWRGFKASTTETLYTYEPWMTDYVD
ncbi:hypothetical protein ACFFV7_41105 [Nonomuraea spiralis]|uniref:Secreted protein n=1 Tax=Nonomuraea spiralis TaxID=46182 RepID=A0ABV5ISV1_9ACTN|nr:hypothetical protein [Nonomuraea spiralis]